ncbi:MAG: YbaN family protein [Burkholderiaceae bacterium]
MLPRLVRIAIWRAVALALVALGLIGVVVPGLPTVPFLIAAAWAASRGWPAFEAWLLNHPRYGPAIRNWREHGAVPRRAKVAAVTMRSISALVLLVVSVPLVVQVGAIATMCVVGTWLWRRPEP